MREKGFINSLVGVASTRLTTTFSLKEGVLVLRDQKGGYITLIELAASESCEIRSDAYFRLLTPFRCSSLFFSILFSPFVFSSSRD